MENLDPEASLASSERISKLIQEANEELSKIKPELDYLENCQNKLYKLKEQQTKLTTFIISLNSILKNSYVINENIINSVMNTENISASTNENNVINKDVTNFNRREIFLPDQAIAQVKTHLRVTGSLNLNYEIFKAVVFNSGTATTEEIKNYLIENNIKQPKTGRTFEDVELKEISSRANYLVRKNILITLASGVFKSVLGWSIIE